MSSTVLRVLIFGGKKVYSIYRNNTSYIKTTGPYVLSPDILLSGTTVIAPYCCTVKAFRHSSVCFFTLKGELCL